jgi:glucokinase
MAKDNLDRLTVVIVVEAANGGDAVALKSLKQVGYHLGIGLASLVNALNPDLVVLGGILSLAGDYLLPPIYDELQRRVILWHESKTQVVLARHGVDACVMGGVALVYQAILAQPSSLARQSILPEPLMVEH